MFCGGVFLSRQERSKHMLDIRDFAFSCPAGL